MASKNPQVRAIELEAKRRSLADDGKTSPKERFAIRKELRAEAGLGKEQKVRGGVAGAYDRNKAYVLPVAAGLAGLTGIGGAFAPAILGGLQGFDRPGEGGIGFDVGSGLKGAAMGAGAGALGAGVGNALNIGVGAVPAAVPAGGAGAAGGALKALPSPGAAVADTMGGSMGGGVMGLPSAVPAGVASGVAPAASWMDRIGGGINNVGEFLNSPGGQAITKLGTAAYGVGQQKKANDLTNRAVADDRARWTAGAPLRQAGMEGLLNPVPASMGNLETLASRGNPFGVVPARRG